MNIKNMTTFEDLMDPTLLVKIFSQVIRSGQLSDIKFLCRCSMVCKHFNFSMPYLPNLLINHHCLEELHELIPKILRKFRFVKYLSVHHALPPSLNYFNWKVTFGLSLDSNSVTYGMTALSYNYIQQRKQNDIVCTSPLEIAPHDTRIQCMSTERYVMHMSKLHDMLMLCVRGLSHLRGVHVTDFRNQGSLVLEGFLLDVLRNSKYSSRKAKRHKLAWFIGNLAVDEFVMTGITTNIILKWKEVPIIDSIANYDNIPRFFELQKAETVYDKALFSILQQHKKSVQVGYNNKLVYPDRYEAIFERPLPVTGIHSKGSLNFGISLRCDLSPNFGIGLRCDLSPYVAQLLQEPNERKKMWRNDYIKEMYSDDSSVQLMGTKRLARLLAEDRRLGDLRAKDVRFLIGFLEHGKNPELQFYGALALTYVDTDGAKIIREEAIPLLVGLMISKHVDTQMRGMFTLMRIAYDFPESFRDFHKIGVLELLNDMVYSHQRNYYELLNCATFLAVVCRAKSNLLACEIRVACHTAKLLLQYGDDEVKPQALLALSYLSHGSYVALERRQRRYILELISPHVDPLIVILTLQVVGNIMAWGSYNQKEFMLTEGLLKRLHELSHREYKILRYDACRILQIIEKGRQAHVHTFVLNRITLPLGDFKIHKKEGTGLCSIIENKAGVKIDLAEHDDDFLESLPIKVQTSSLDMSSFMPLSPNEKVTTKFLDLKWMAEFYTSKEFSCSN